MLKINDKTQSRQLNLVLATTQSSMFVPCFFRVRTERMSFSDTKG